MPWETVLLDSPLLQRLRGVRQLGMAHLVYPGAGHDRLEHIKGVVEAAERMIRALERNADYRRRFGEDRDENVPQVSDEDRYATRLAALLHDIGHGPFSHATEQLIEERYEQEFRDAVTVLRYFFEGVTSIAPSETIATLVVLSDPMDKVLTHPQMAADTGSNRLPVAVAARILGSRSCLKAGYLSGIISGPVDADKLDYVARDCHHSGLPLGIDLTRLISKLEVVVVTPDNAPNEELRERAERSPESRFYDIGISQTGLGSYEQLIIARVLLYDRLYYHHKIRAAESMLQSLIRVAEDERDAQYSIRDLFAGPSDDVLVSAVGGELRSESLESGGDRSRVICRAIQERRIHYRAYAFAARFIAGTGGLPEDDQQDTRALMWRRLIRELTTGSGRRSMARRIHAKAVELSRAIADLGDHGAGLQEDEILVDLPVNRVVVRGGDILTRTDKGHIGTPNLFFDPERWSKAYEHQKQCGFVFTPRRRVPLVALASRIVFYQHFGVIMDQQAHRAAKVTDVVDDEWVKAARDKSLCSFECAEVLQGSRPRLLSFRADDLELPQDWSREDPGAAERLAGEINRCLPGGLPGSVHRAVAATIRDLAFFANMIEQSGTWIRAEDLPEKDLQSKLREHLHSRGATVSEAAEVGGGETDLIIGGRIVVENKVGRERVGNPLAIGPHYAWQARRYRMALCTRVAFVVFAYRPADEAARVPLPNRIAARAMHEAPEDSCVIRVVLPWGDDVASSAKRPGSSGEPLDP